MPWIKISKTFIYLVALTLPFNIKSNTSFSRIKYQPFYRDYSQQKFNVQITSLNTKPHTPCGKFRKYCHMRQLSENTFQSFNMEVYEKIFFLVEFLVFQVSRENY